MTRKLNSRGRKRSQKFLLALVQILIIGLISLAAIGVAAGLGAFRSIVDAAPDVSNIDVTPTGFSTFVYDSEGTQIAKLVSTDSNRIPVTQDMIPPHLGDAFVAIEDERFYQHHGIDIQGIIRAGYTGITSGSFSQGASTITQQLLKNNVFTGWTKESFTDSIQRKIQEQYLAVEIEKRMSKEDILLNYMNTINLGHNTLGVQAASLRYFDKSVSDLTLSECAVIAAITQNPSGYDPIVFPEKNRERQERVLGKMKELGMISQTEYDTAMADDVYSRIKVVDNNTDDNTINSYFVDALTNQVLADLMAAGFTETQAYTKLYSGGLNIYSTQDPAIQKICDDYCSNPDNFPAGTRFLLSYRLSVETPEGEAVNYSAEMLQSWLREQDGSASLLFTSEEAAHEAIERYKAAVVPAGSTETGEYISLTPQPQIALAIQDQSNGQVVALVGGRGVKTANRTLNRATDSYRQPGSTFKVVAVYAPALDSAGLTLATPQMDEPFTYEDGTPVRNWYGESYRGIQSLRDGIRDSLNIVAVKTLLQITPRLGMDYLKNFGFTTLVESETIDGRVYSDVNLSLGLGGITKGVKPIELNAAYATIANGGVYYAPKLYTKITDHDGNVILDNTGGNAETHRVLTETTAWLLTSAMEDVVTGGTGGAVNFGTTKIAGKTGTTSDYNDVWFAGYTDYYTCTVWAGYDDNTKLLPGGERSLAQSIWRGCMQQIHEGLPYRDFVMPAGIHQLTVCKASGKLPVPGTCDATLVTEYFADGTDPTTPCDAHVQGRICAYSGLPAADACPFAVQGIVTVDPTNAGQLCEHTAEFVNSDEGRAVIQLQNAELLQRNAAAQFQAAQQHLANCTAQLQTVQQNLLNAQASGDEAAISAAQQAVNAAQQQYNDAVKLVNDLQEILNPSSP